LWQSERDAHLSSLATAENDTIFLVLCLTLKLVINKFCSKVIERYSAEPFSNIDFIFLAIKATRRKDSQREGL